MSSNRKGGDGGRAYAFSRLEVVGVAPRADADDDAATEGRSADGDDDDDEGASRAVDDDASADDEGDDDEEYEDELGLSSDGD